MDRGVQIPRAARRGFLLRHHARGSAARPDPLYDIRSFEGRDSFSWGSWIIPPPPVPGLASYSALAIYEIGFSGLGFDQSHFDVRKGNTKVLGFHTGTGATVVSEDAENFYFVFERERYPRLLADKAAAVRHHGAIL